MRKQLGIDEQKPNDWFETLYAKTSRAGEGVPWANMATHPLFKSWLNENEIRGRGKTALVVGCGLGDDAIELETRGFDVTAFDVSASAIELCKTRFPESEVEFVQADLIKGVSGWYRKFDLVLEIFTIQALPPKYEKKVIQNIADFVAEDGRLLLITEIQQNKRSYENGPPWLLNDDYVQSFETADLRHISQIKSQNTEMGDEIHLCEFERNKAVPGQLS